MFEWENAVPLHAMQGNWASSRGEREVSWIFSCCGRYMGYILELRRGGHSKREFVFEVRTLV